MKTLKINIKVPDDFELESVEYDDPEIEESKSVKPELKLVEKKSSIPRIIKIKSILEKAAKLMREEIKTEQDIHSQDNLNDCLIDLEAMIEGDWGIAEYIRGRFFVGRNGEMKSVEEILDESVYREKYGKAPSGEKEWWFSKDPKWRATLEEPMTTRTLGDKMRIHGDYFDIKGAICRAAIQYGWDVAYLVEGIDD